MVNYLSVTQKLDWFAICKPPICVHTLPLGFGVSSGRCFIASWPQTESGCPQKIAVESIVVLQCLRSGRVVIFTEKTVLSFSFATSSTKSAHFSYSRCFEYCWWMLQAIWGCSRKIQAFPLNYRLSMQHESKHQHEPSLHWAGLGAGRVASRWGKERMLTIHFLRSFPEGLTFQSLLWPPSSTWKDENVCDVVCPSSTRRGHHDDRY